VLFNLNYQHGCRQETKEGAGEHQCPSGSGDEVRQVLPGYKQTLKTLRQGKAKLVLIASNTPALR